MADRKDKTEIWRARRAGFNPKGIEIRSYFARQKGWQVSKRHAVRTWLRVANPRSVMSSSVVRG